MIHQPLVWLGLKVQLHSPLMIRHPTWFVTPFAIEDDITLRC